MYRLFLTMFRKKPIYQSQLMYFGEIEENGFQNVKTVFEEKFPGATLTGVQRNKVKLFKREFEAYESQHAAGELGVVYVEFLS